MKETDKEVSKETEVSKEVSKETSKETSKLKFEKIDNIFSKLKLKEVEIEISNQTMQWLKRAEKDKPDLMVPLMRSKTEEEATGIIVMIKEVIQKLEASEKMQKEGKTLKAPKADG